MVSDNKRIHLDSEHMVKDWEGTWQEIRQTIHQVQEWQWYDQKRQPGLKFAMLEDGLTGSGNITDRVIFNHKNRCTKSPMEIIDHMRLGPFIVEHKIRFRA